MERQGMERLGDRGRQRDDELGTPAITSIGCADTTVVLFNDGLDDVQSQAARTGGDVRQKQVMHDRVCDPQAFVPNDDFDFRRSVTGQDVNGAARGHCIH